MIAKGKLWVALAASMAGMLAFAACGGGEAAEVKVTLEQDCRAVAATPATAPHGRVTFQLTNRGTTIETFAVRYAVPDLQRTDPPVEVGPGRTITVHTELGDPGSYQLACEVGGTVVSTAPFTVGLLSYKLVQGNPAPSWSGPLLGGGTLRLKDLRGRPVLVLFVADWCDRACDVLPQFQQASQQWADRVSFVLIDFSSTSDKMEKAAQEGGYKFPVVVDSSGKAGKAWGVQGVPTWVLLDAEGRAVEARTRPQTLAELNDLLAKTGQ